MFVISVTLSQIIRGRDKRLASQLRVHVCRQANNSMNRCMHSLERFELVSLLVNCARGESPTCQRRASENDDIGRSHPPPGPSHRGRHSVHSLIFHAVKRTVSVRTARDRQAMTLNYRDAAKRQVHLRMTAAPPQTLSPKSSPETPPALIGPSRLLAASGWWLWLPRRAHFDARPLPLAVQGIIHRYAAQKDVGNQNDAMGLWRGMAMKLAAGPLMVSLTPNLRSPRQHDPAARRRRCTAMTSSATSGAARHTRPGDNGPQRAELTVDSVVSSSGATPYCRAGVQGATNPGRSHVDGLRR